MLRFACFALGRRCWVVLFCSCLLGTVQGAGQQQDVPGDAAGDYHLKVYEDLLQLPTLVLNSREESFAGLRAQDFRIELDRGPAFEPLHARLEGDDPITMALLFDDAGVETSAMLATAMPALQRHLLPERFPGRADEVEMYAMDCNLVRARTLSGSESGAGAVLRDLLDSPTLHADAESTACARPVHLWDALSVVGRQLREQSGRRVLVVVTDGRDIGSRNSWEAVRQYLGGAGITLFAIQPVSPPLLPLDAPERPAAPERNGREDRLALLAGGTGGLVIHLYQPDLADLLMRVVSLLRKRYILEFNRPRNGTAGLHEVDVLLPGRNARVRTSGVTVPLRDADDGSDPARVPRDDSHDPVVGSRKVLTSPEY